MHCGTFRVPLADFEQGLRFYTRALGFPPQVVGERYACWRIGGVRLSLSAVALEGAPFLF